MHGIILMEFYFCGQYINTEVDDKEVERDMYEALPCFSGSDDQYGYEKWESNLEDFFSYFILTSEQKCHYARMKLVGKAHCWRKTSHIDYRCWFALKDLLRALYAPRLLYLSEANYKGPEAVKYSEPESEAAAEPESEPTVVDKPELESKVTDELEPEVAIEPESEPTVIDDPELEPEIEELLVEMSEDLPAELAIELVSSTPVVRVSVILLSSDLYDPLQIFLQQTGPQLIKQFMVRRTVDLVLIRENAPLFAICTLLELSSSIANLSWKPIPPPPPWLRHDVSVLILRPPPWPD